MNWTLSLRLSISMLISALLLWIGFVSWALHADGARHLFPDLVLTPTPLDWRIIEGEGAMSGSSMSIHGPGDRARWVLAVRLPDPIRADRYNRVLIQTGNNAPTRLAVNWSQTSHYLPTSSLPLAESETGQQQAQLNGLPGWQGEIHFLGLESFGALSEPLEIHAIHLQQVEADLAGLHQRLAEDWLAFPSWSQQSINFTLTGFQRSPISLLVVIAMWILVSGLLLLLLSKKQLRQSLPWLLVPVIAGWLILDLRWQATLLGNASQAVQELRALSVEEKRRFDQDPDLYHFMSKLPDMGQPEFSGRVFAVGQHDYWRTRIRYHLLPLSVRTAGVEDWDEDALAGMQAGDIVILLDTPSILVETEEQTLLHAHHDNSKAIPVEALAELNEFQAFRVLKPRAPDNAP